MDLWNDTERSLAELNTELSRSDDPARIRFMVVQPDPDWDGEWVLTTIWELPSPGHGGESGRTTGLMKYEQMVADRFAGIASTRVCSVPKRRLQEHTAMHYLLQRQPTGPEEPVTPEALLDAAELLVSPTHGTPSRARIRRSISTAYYSLFTALTAEVARPYRGEAKVNARRLVEHGKARTVCETS